MRTFERFEIYDFMSKSSKAGKMRGRRNFPLQKEMSNNISVSKKLGDLRNRISS
jgi:hypothetical protein